MNHELFLLPFLRALLVSSGLTLFFIFLAKNFSLFPKKVQKHHIHKEGISRFGGAAIIIAFVSAIFLDENLVVVHPLWGVVVAAFLILFFGILDDFLNLDWKKQLFFQICSAILIFIFGVCIEYITSPFGGIVEFTSADFSIASLFLGITWMVVMMNSMNWFDGIDGASAGITFLGAIAIIFVSLKPEVNQPPMAILAAILAGAVLGFLIFNFHPSKIMAGTSGSIFMGFILAVLAIFSGAKIATTLLVMTLPLADSVWVIWKRIQSGSSAFSSDNRHLHHCLMKLGWSQKKIAILFYVITGIIVVIALNTRALGKMVAILMVFALSLIMMFFVDKQLLKKEKLDAIK
ncbi:MAG: undecaprenyl/decaprenyl-phosphate alpha-N-acetylglucosaminyl 1-phosphate transferase [Candidatus Moranbacteria bacterium]|jgi:UDP-GlcNAc:undecaprenyl-phosphate GlcNAc-1-phosphate transferase|nr:undecaprenyl/decaprenyl-phosphate alpha-N-acetylglucosaminyl 1-phosphate transferase [Candidatus Moranbacteria bacterium]